MATEEKIILSADATEAIKTIGELKQQIADLKSVLDDSALSTDELKAKLAELQNQCNALTEAMSGSIVGLTEIQNAANDTIVSYDTLVSGMQKIGEATSIADLQTQIGELKQIIADESTTINDLSAAIELLKEKQQALSAVIAGSIEDFKAVQKSIESVTKSYKALANEAENTKAADSASELTKQIQQLIDTINGESASVRDSATATELLKDKEQSLSSVTAENAEAFKKAKESADDATKSYSTLASETNKLNDTDVAQVATSVAELKAQIKELRDTIVDETSTVTESAAAAELLKEKQQALRAVMAGSAEAFFQAQEATEGTTQSYNSLVNEMGRLKAAWRATTDEAERNALGQQINNINEQLKSLDASTGNFQRNVGDYANQMQKGFAATAGSANKIINPLKNVKGAMQAVSATPLVAILGLIANVITVIIDKLKSSEENMNANAEAMSGFAVIGDILQKTFQALGTVITFVVEGLGSLLTAITGTNEATEERIRLARMEKDLMIEERENIMLNAEAELESAKLRSAAADKYNNSAKERIQLLTQAGDIEKKIAERNKHYAEQEYELIKRKNALTQSSTEEKKKEAEAYAKMLQAQTAYFNKTKEITAQISEAQKANAAEAEKAAQEQLKIQQTAAQKEAELLTLRIGNLKQWSKEAAMLQMEKLQNETDAAIKKAEQEIKDETVLQQTILELQKQYEIKRQDIADKANAARLLIAKQNNLNAQALLKAGSQEQLKLQLELKEFEERTLFQRQDETDAAYTARLIKVRQERDAAEQEYLNAKYEAEKRAYMNALEFDEGDPYLNLKQRLEDAKYDYENMFQGVTESEEQFYQRRLIAEQNYITAKTELEQSYKDPFQRDMEVELEQLDQNSIIYLEKELALKKYELDTIHQLEGESEDQFRKRQLQKEKEYNADKKKLSQARVNTAMQFVSATSGLMNSLAAMYESDTDASEEELRKAKNLKIAGAVMSTIEGAVGAYTSGINSGIPAPGNMILAILQAATATAAGMANVRQIASTDVSKNSSNASVSSSASTGIALPASASSAVTSAPTMDTTIESVRTITTASEEEALNQSQKVYLVTDELEMAQNSKKVRMAESTF